MPARSPIRILLVFLALCFSVRAAAADDDDDEDSFPGLDARYTAGNQTVERIDRDVQFVWGVHAPDARLPAGPFSARWMGKLLIRAEGKHAFHLYLQGEATVTLNGKPVVSGKRDTPGWVEGNRVEVDFGEQKLEIAYKRTADKGVLRLFWSSESFPTEPILPQLFFRDAARPEIDAIERGRDLYEAHRCAACHARENNLGAEPAPALAHKAAALNSSWLIDWLRDPSRETLHGRMPAFGFSRDEAAAVAAFLLQQQAGEPAASLAGEASEKSSARQGEVLFRSVGCLACHTRAKEGDPALHGGGDLTNVGQKRSVVWLAQWLKEPEKLNPDHRMPVFKLSDAERHSLALFLAGPPAEKVTPRPPEANEKQIALGKTLIEMARCAACHKIPDIKVDTAAIPTLEKPVKDWSKACSEATADPTHIRPTYTFAEADRRALRAFIELRIGRLTEESPFDRGEHLLRKRGCLNCHERDGGRGIAVVAVAMARRDADLTGQSEALVPPNLSAVGDKLRDEPLTAAISGKQKTVRLPWLKVRMPRFEHSAAEAAALVAYLAGHDRIPEGAPTGLHPVTPAATESASAKERAELRKAGLVLAGTRGFSCVACHKVAAHEPRSVALATRGSDLYLLGDRMRPEYFSRWTRAPLRIVPNMEMPSFERPIAGILEGHLDRQLAALWEAFNDRSAPPKIDTSTIEQLLTVSETETPKVIRDVFMVGDPVAPKFVPRAFAIGLWMRANVLFDLDTMAVRDVWFGDFARQRSSGKSWFWEAASPHVAWPIQESPDIALRKKGDGKAPVLIARKESGRFGKLRSYAWGVPPIRTLPSNGDTGIALRYTLTFDVEPGVTDLKTIEVTDLFHPPSRHYQPPADRSCFRAVTVADVPAGYDVLLRQPAEAQSGVSVPASETGYKTLRFRPETASAQSMAVFAVEPPTAVPAPTIAPAVPAPVPQIERVTTVPGYDGVRLPLPGSIMPTAITWMADGTLAFCSLKGQVFLAKDTDGDGIEDKLILFEEGLAAPYGLIADGRDLIVAHKPELLRLRDTDGDGRADVRAVVADGWGYSDDYHDWTTGIVRDSVGNLYVGTGSDYTNPKRDKEKSKWRGKLLRIDPQGVVTPLGHALRYPTGLAITPDDQIFVTDNQGVQNTFNEINHLVAGASYGVPGVHEENPNAPATLPAIQVPHPWTRSVNGIFFLPASTVPAAFAGHGIGCEYDNRFLVRFTLQRVGKTCQGAVYPFSLPALPAGAAAREGFSGTLCGAVSPKGDIYIGSFHDSGWLGGTNVGDLVRLRPNGKLPAGIREIRAAQGQFLISFTAPVDKAAAARVENYDIAGYTRKWQGTYATPDSGRHKLEIESVAVAPDGLSAVVHTSRQQEGHVYEINVGKIGPKGQENLWPSAGHYTLNQMPD